MSPAPSEISLAAHHVIPTVMLVNGNNAFVALLLYKSDCQSLEHIQASVQNMLKDASYNLEHFSFPDILKQIPLIAVWVPQIIVNPITLGHRLLWF